MNKSTNICFGNRRRVGDVIRKLSVTFDEGEVRISVRNKATED